MAKLGDDVYEWNVDQLVSWLRAEGLNDCVRTFVLKKIDGCKLLNLSDSEIKSLHVSNESKKKLLKAVEKFHKRKKEKLGRMFGDSGKVQKVVGRRPTSISNDEGASDEEGWDSEEWDSGSAGGESSSDGGGEYLEPEEDFSKPKGSYERETAPVQTGLVAQLKQGIAQSLVRMTLPPSQDFEEDEDIYDVPPEEEDQDLYEEPSDSSGGAVVVRPPSKPPRVNDGEYLLTRGGDQEEQDMYEAPMEGEDISPAPPLASRQRNFIPTKVAQGNKFVSVSAMNENVETYDVPELDDSDEDSYEIPDTATEVAPPPRPPKNTSKQSPAAQAIPSRPPKQTTPQAKVGRPPPQESSMPHSKPKPLSQHGTPFQPHSNTLPSQGSPVRHPNPKPNALPQQNRPSTLPKQLSPTHHAKPNALSSNLQPPKSPTRHSNPNSQGPPKATKWAPKSIPSQTQNFVPQPAEEKRPILAPRVSPRPKPVADPSKRRPAPPPLNEPTSPQRTSAPVPPPVNEAVRKVSGPKSGPPDSPKLISGPPEGKPPSPAAGRNFPSLTPRGGLLTQRDPPSTPAPEPPQKSTSGPPLPFGSGRRPLSRGIHEKPSLPEPSPTEPALPPRPPKHGSSAQPALPARQGQTERKSAPLPAPPGTEKKSAPLPVPPLERKNAPPPVMNSHQSMSSSREQSSGSSIESGSADEPVVSFGQNRIKTTASQRHSAAHRGLPMPPPSEAKSPLDIMKEAPWFHGPADRKRSEVNLKSTNMDGAFLVRNSSKNPNDYSLSLLYKASIRHLKLPKKDGQYVLGASGIQKFDSVIELINYYRQHEVDLVSGGKTKLTIHAQNIAR